MVHLANSSGDSLDAAHRQLDATRKSVSDLVAENEALKQEIERLRMARLMTIQETAKRHGRRVLDVFYRRATLAGKFPDALLRYIYAGPGMAGS